MCDELIAAINHILNRFNDLVGLLHSSQAFNLMLYEPRARPTHWQRIPEPKTKPHTLPVIFRKRVFHCRNCLPFVLVIVDEE